MERIFLGLDRPPLHVAAEMLVQRRARDGALFLNDTIVVTPGGKAGRRLGELLMSAAQQEGLRFLPPEIITVGRLPELLYRTQRPLATEWVQQLTWSWAIRSVAPTIRDDVFPEIPRDAEQRWGVEPWLQLGRLLRNTYRELAAAGLAFDDVKRMGADIPGFEISRWGAMAAIQQEYLGLLDERGVWDRQTARLVAVRQNECATEKSLVLVGLAEQSRTLRNMLEQVASQVTAMVAAPQEWADRFDPSGCLIPQTWSSADISWDREQLQVKDGPSEQAEAVIVALSQWGDKYMRDGISIGMPNNELMPYVERALSRYGIATHSAQGRSIGESGPYRLLRALHEWLLANRFHAFASIVRHPDIARWLLDQDDVQIGWVQELDEYRQNHLPVVTDGRWLGPVKARRRLMAVWQHMEELRAPFLDSDRSLREWSDCIRRLLVRIYGGCEWDAGNPRHRLATGAAREINRVLLEQSQLPEDIATSLSAAQALELLVEQLAGARIALPAESDAVELAGWLELPLDDSPAMVLTGLNEGIVPQNVASDMFLPNTLRVELGVDDNEGRYARDAFALASLLRQRPGLPMIVGMRDAKGDPLIPSRLLFAGDAETISRRWLDFFDGGSSVAMESPTKKPSETPLETPSNPAAENRRLRFDGAEQPGIDPHVFGFTVPRPKPLERPVERMRTTDFRSYMACPYRFYLQRVLRLSSISDEADEMDGGLFGTVVHEVLNEFGLGDKKDSTDAQEIFAELKKLLRREATKRFGRNKAPAVRVQIQQMEMRFQAFAAEQAQWARDYEIELVEEPTDQCAEIELPDGRLMLISGRIDRIDRHRETGERVILDYKTSDMGKTTREAHHSKDGEWIDLQLPMYRRLAQAMGLENIVDMGYILLPKKLDAISFSLAKWTEDELRAADRCAEEVVEQILDERFWPPGETKWSNDEFGEVLLSGILEYSAE